MYSINRRLISAFLALVLVGVGLYTVSPAQAATFAVACDTETNTGDVNDLISRIDQANVTPEADTIVLGTNCVYSLTTPSAVDSVFGDVGLPKITTNMTIQGDGSIIQLSPESQSEFRLLLVEAPGVLTLNGVTVRDGISNLGAGMLVKTGGSSRLINSSFVDNDANFFGGGILSYGDLFAINSTIGNNEAGEDGGGLITYDGNVTLVNVTISGNRAKDGAGFNVDPGTASVTLRNTLIGGNFATESGGEPDVFDGLGNMTGNNNLVSTVVNFAQFSFSNGVDGNIIGSEQSPQNPLLSALSPTPPYYFATSSGSPALEAGDNASFAAAVPVGFIIDQDIAGNNRLIDIDSSGTAEIDIGSFEAPPANLSEPVLNKPNSVDLLLPNTTVLLEWNDQEDADSFKVDLIGPTGFNFYGQEFDSNNCDGTICELSVNIDGDQGEYFVFIQPRTSSGFVGPVGQSTFNMGFIQPFLTAPGGQFLQVNPIGLRWEYQQGTSYIVNVYDSFNVQIYNNTVSAGTGNCVSITCELEVPYNNTLGVWQVWIIPVANGVFGSWTQSEFEVIAFDRVFLTSPSEGTRLSPSSTTTLDITFNAQEGVELFDINVYDPDGLIFTQTDLDASTCTDGVCTINIPAYDGSIGTYSAWIRPKTPDFAGPWAGTQFSVQWDPVTLTSPTGELAPKETFTLTWDHQAGVEFYQMDVYTPQAQVVDSDIDASTACTETTCTLDINYGGTGTYAAWILPKSSDGIGLWQDTTFNVFYQPVGLTTPQNIVAPQNIIQLQWPVEQYQTTGFQFNLYSKGQTILSETAYNVSNCSGGVCTIDLPIDEGGFGEYDMWMRVLAPNGVAGPWSLSEFDIRFLPATLSAPTDIIAPSGQLNLVWDHQPGVKFYTIDFYDPFGTKLYNQRYDASQCSDNTCTLDVVYDGPTGIYTVWMVPDTGDYFGNWAQSQFEVNFIPTVLTSPVNEIAPVETLTLTWPLQPGIETYFLDLYDPFGQLLVNVEPYNAVDVCVDGVCSVDIPYNKFAGTYQAWMIPYTNSKFGAWTPSFFDVAFQNVTLSEPTGISAPFDEVTLRWAEAPGATSYFVNTYSPKPGVPALFEGEVFAANACNAGLCSLTITTGRDVGLHETWIIPFGNGKFGNWSLSEWQFDLAEISLVSPTGTIPNNVPIFLQWPRYGDADYIVNFYGPNGLVAALPLYDHFYCGVNLCVWGAIPYDGAAGQYEVWVIAVADDDFGTWTQSTFNVISSDVGVLAADAVDMLGSAIEGPPALDTSAVEAPVDPPDALP